MPIVAVLTMCRARPHVLALDDYQQAPPAADGEPENEREEHERKYELFATFHAPCVPIPRLQALCTS